MTNPQNRKREVVLAALPGTVGEVAAKAGVCRSTARDWLKRLSAPGPERCVRVCGWRRHPGGFVPAYELGTRPNVPCKLKPLTGAQTSARWRTKMRREGLYPRILAGRRALHNAKGKSYLQDPLMALLYRPVSQPQHNDGDTAP